MATRQTAHRVPAGHWQYLASLDFVGFRDEEQEMRLPGAQVEVGARRGLSPDLDAGLKLHGLALVADVKWRLVEGPFSVAISPSLDLCWTPETGATTNAFHGFA